MSAQPIGRYQILGILGQGAMGIVYECWDPHLTRTVAVKTMLSGSMPPELAADLGARFLTEARSVARLHHDGIVSLYDAGMLGEQSFLVMEFFDGINLQTCITQQVRFTPNGAVQIAIQVLAALDHAHKHKIIHRDVKPGNILLDATGAVKLTDFGIAKILEAGADNGTQVLGLRVGTPRYMSPEQVRGEEVDARSDVYSAGVLLYELLTGKTPFGHGQGDLFKAIIEDMPIRVSTLDPSLTPLDAILAKGMAKAKAERYQSAQEFKQALAALALSTKASAPNTATDLVQPASRPQLSAMLESSRAARAARPATAQPQIAPQSTPSPAPAAKLEPKASLIEAAPLKSVQATSHRLTSFEMRPWLSWLTILVLATALGLLSLSRETKPALPISQGQAMQSLPLLRSSESAPTLEPTQPQLPEPKELQSAPASEKVHPATAEALPEADPVDRVVENAATEEPSMQRVPQPPRAAQPTLSSTRCSLLLEKAGSGEPLSNREQAELTSLCR